jgi:hypothetical protein
MHINGQCEDRLFVVNVQLVDISGRALCPGYFSEERSW